MLRLLIFTGDEHRFRIGKKLWQVPGGGVILRTYTVRLRRCKLLCEFYRNGWISTIKETPLDDFTAKSNQ
jgi:hypothetical protein